MRDAVEIARQLVRIPSVNPMGRSQPLELLYEHRVTEFISGFFTELDVEHQVLPVETVGSIQRSNLVGWIPGTPDPQKAATVMLQAHQDTVPVDGMTIDPFAAELRDGRIYGRGACDVKGGLATILSVAARLVHERSASQPNVLLGFTMNEEFGFTGAAAMAGLIKTGDLPGRARRPDCIVVAEPTSLNVVTAHKGVIRWRAHTKGVAAHSSNPSRGVNAIFAMGHLLSAIEEYHEQHLMLTTNHPTLGHPSISVGTIRGGISVNTIPDECVIEIDRRTLPPEEPGHAREAVIEFLADLDVGEATLVHDPPFMASVGLANHDNLEVATQLRDLARSQGSSSQITSAAYGTDAAELSQCGAPTLVFGPGHIAQAHTEDEWIETDQIERASAILWEFLHTQSGTCLDRLEA